ncbi:MAG: DUF423 domain-containing protein [Bacteroidota bacterium]
MTKKLIQLASLMALLAVVLGAFGAHGLKALITPEKIQVFEVGVRYHFYHSLAIGFIALAMSQFNSKWLERGAWMFLIGILLFSGSLYLLACRAPLDIEHWAWLGPITPIGGTCFIIGWAFIFIGVSKQN